MSRWNEIYSHGSIHTHPSKEIINFVPFLKSKRVHSVLDAGCGTGRHSHYLAQHGFDVHGIDISEQAIRFAEAEANRSGYSIDYRVGTLVNLPFAPDSMDFILANHSLEYATETEVQKSIASLDSVLRNGKPFFARVASTQHPLYQAAPEEVYGFSHIGFCIKNGLPVQFFDEETLRDLFKDYRIERLEHLVHHVDHEKISIPLAEWVLLGYKK